MFSDLELRNLVLIHYLNIAWALRKTIILALHRNSMSQERHCYSNEFGHRHDHVIFALRGIYEWIAKYFSWIFLVEITVVKIKTISDYLPVFPFLTLLYNSQIFFSWFTVCCSASDFLSHTTTNYPTQQPKNYRIGYRSNIKYFSRWIQRWSPNFKIS